MKVFICNRHIFYRYYSSLDQKYLQVIIKNRHSSTTDQQEILENGFQLASLLNRTLILPKFFCKDKQPCNYNPQKINKLDKNIGTNNYREHVFLQHPLVPNQVKNSLSGVLNFKFISNRPKASVVEKMFYEYRNTSVIMVELNQRVKFRFNSTIENQMRKTLHP